MCGGRIRETDMFKKLSIAAALATASSFGTASEAELPANTGMDETLLITYSERDSLAQLTEGGFVEIIDRKTIQNFQVRSLGELLSKLPSITSYDLSGNGLEPIIGLRGFGQTASQNTLITLNGIPLNPATNEGPALGAISLDSIERIEIRPRGSSVLHGGGAVAGVVNLVTKLNPESSAEIEIGDFGREKLAVTKSAASFSVTASIQNVDGYRRNTDEQSKSASFNSFYSDKNASHQWFGQFDKADRGYLSGSTPEMLADEPTGGKTADRNSRDYIFLGYKRQSSNIDLSVGAFQSDQEGTVSGSTRFSQSGRSLRTNIERTEWSSDTTFGLELHLDDSEFSSPDGAAAYATTESNGLQLATSIYGKHNFSLDDQTSITIGGRYSYLDVDVFKRSYATGSAVDDNLETNQDALSLEFALVKQIGKGTKVSLATNRSVRFATIDEQQSNAVLPAALEPQIGTGINLGVAHKIPTAEIRAEIYRLNLSDEIGYVDNPGFNNDGNFNIEKSKRSGVNVTSNLDLSSSLSFGLSASYIDAKATSGSQAGKRIPLVSMKSMGASVAKQFAEDWRAQFSWLSESDKVLGSDYNNEGIRIASQSKSDFSIEKEFNDTRIKLGVNNLFDQSFYTYGVRGFSTINSVSGYYDFFVPADPRSIALSINTRF
jgi:iron complex outermembrane receptor protein